MTENKDNILDALPARLKTARKSQGLSLDAIANLSGVSRSMVSQIERGESSPTIATLMNLTRALNIDFAGLLEQKDQHDQIDVLKSTDVPTIDNMGQGCSIAILSPPQDAGKNEIYDITFQPAGQLTSQPHSRGSVEQLTVISGSVQIISGTAISEIHQGDTAHYAADLPHEIKAVNGSARIFLFVKSQ